MNNKTKKAVFLDRDGTIIEDVGYLSCEKDIRLLRGSYQAVRLLKAAGFKVIVITNQAAIARGVISEQRFLDLNNKILDRFKKLEAKIDGSYYCPHHPFAGSAQYKKECNCRKPSPGMLLKAAKENDIDLKQSYMVGDKDIDVEAGKASGCKSILVLTGYGIDFKNDPNLKADYIANNIVDAAKWIIENRNIRGRGQK